METSELQAKISNAFSHWSDGLTTKQERNFQIILFLIADAADEAQESYELIHSLRKTIKEQREL